MSRIDALECQYTDLEWYGMDRMGNIAVFLSSGCANVPEFVCGDRERTEALIEYFENADYEGGCILHGAFPEGTAKMAREMTARGVYCYDAVEGQRYYRKLARPEHTLTLTELPRPIRDMLECNRVEVDSFQYEEHIDVSHAYE